LVRVIKSQNGITSFLTTKMGGFHKTEKLKKLVTEVLNLYAKLLGKDGVLEIHNNTHYHKNAV